jgi:hypothetical protein
MPKKKVSETILSEKQKLYVQRFRVDPVVLVTIYR